MTLELCYRYEYLNISLDDFYKKGYDVVKERDTKVIGEKLKIIYESLLKKEDK